MKIFKSKNIIYALLLVGFVFILFWENKKLSVSLDTAEIESNSNKAKKNSSTTTDSAEIAGATTASTVVSNSSQARNDSVEFADWLKSESQLLDKNDPNNLDKESVLKVRAARFSVDEIQYLKKTATDTNVSANERITAVYFLTIASEMALPALFDVAEAALSLQNPQPVHSLGETTLMQEKAIRIVAIDELFIRYQNNAITRIQLENCIQRISDPGLKQYATNRLLELK